MQQDSNSNKRYVYDFDTLVAFVPIKDVVYQFPAFSIEYVDAVPRPPGDVPFASGYMFKVKFRFGSTIHVRWGSGTGNVSPLCITRKILFLQKNYYLIWQNGLGMATGVLSERELSSLFATKSQQYWQQKDN